MIITLVTILHLIVCVMLIGIVLLQQGKGADMGATFGGGGSTLFGASGANTFLTRLTTFTAVCFMCTSVFLAIHLKGNEVADGTLFKDAPKASAEIPVAPQPKPETNPQVDMPKAEPESFPAPAAQNPPAAPKDEAAAAEKKESEKTN